MKHCIAMCFFALAAISLSSLPAATVAADDAKSAGKEPPAKAPDFSKYVFVKDVTGEVTKADDKKISITVKFTVNTQPNPKLPPRLVEKHQDFEFQFLPESLVRTSFLPKKLDDKGKKVEYTQKEKDALKTPPGVTGYAANFADLTPGSTVNVILIRDKSIPAGKATDEDLRVKYAVIQSPPPAK